MNKLNEFQQVLLQTFKEFARFCEQNDIKYFAAFGTLLGVIRHHGFIPWDDDIDVMMMRQDYEKFLTAREQLRGSNYWVSDIRDGEHPYAFAKFYTNACTVWEVRQFPFIIGPWIDIFPVDEYTPSSETDSKLYDEYHHALWNYRKAMSYQSWKEIGTDFIRLNGFNGPIKLVKQCFYKPFRSRYFNRVKRLQKQVNAVRGTHYKPWTEVKRRIYEKGWFADARPMPFEDTTMLVPNGWHELLTDSYGDYMTPPPAEKQVPNHHYYFVDLTKAMTRKEIESTASLVKTEASPLSFKVLIDEIKHRKGFN